jgi:hypothetical protein
MLKNVTTYWYTYHDSSFVIALWSAPQILFADKTLHFLNLLVKVGLFCCSGTGSSYVLYLNFLPDYTRKVQYIERPDQGHLYPLGEPRDKCHSRGANLRPPAPQASALPKELSRQLIAGYSELLLGASGRPPTRAPPVHVYTWTLLDVGRIALARP